MRYSTIEIRWHDTLPMYSVDAQPFECETHKRKINPYQKTAENTSDGDGKLWRLATAGGDKKVRIWLAIPSPPVHANTNGTSTSNGSSKATIMNANNASSSSTTAAAPVAGKPKVEYMATLDKHTLTVNVVRFSPAGNLLATAGDGTAGIFIWRLSANAPSASFGSRSEDAAYEREAWQAIKMIKTKSPEIYDLVWSPDGEYILTGGTDATARVYRVSDGTCVAELTDHKDWVQGVAWDPLNQFIATQGKDRAMHIYSIDTSSPTEFNVKLISKNSRLTSETVHPPPSAPATSRSGSPLILSSDNDNTTSIPVASTSASTSLTAQQPAHKTTTHSHAMYGDEETSPFFRRLAFATDGSLLLTPTGIIDTSSSTKKSKKVPLSTEPPSDKKNPKESSNSSAIKQKKLPLSSLSSTASTPTVYMFARGGFENHDSPIACLPGHKTISIVVKFNPVLWDLRSGSGKKKDVKGKGKEIEMDMQVKAMEGEKDGGMQIDDDKTTEASAVNGSGESVTAHPANGQSIDTNMEEEGKAASTSKPKGIFDLKQRSIYAVATYETILMYDTQQALPICMFGSLHFAAFTDLTWTGDGLTLIATSSDGYASIFTFEEGELGTPSTQQPSRQASKYEEGLLANTTAAGMANGSGNLVSSPIKPITATGGAEPIIIASSPAPAQVPEKGETEVIMLDGESQEGEQPPKKEKKRAQLTFVSALP